MGQIQKFKCCFSTADGRFLVGNDQWVDPYDTPWDFFLDPANAELIEICHNYPNRILIGEITDGVFTVSKVEEVSEEIYYGDTAIREMLTSFHIDYEPPKTNIYYSGEPVLDIWSDEAKKNLAQKDISPAYVPYREGDYAKTEKGGTIIDNKSIKSAIGTEIKNG